MSDTREVTITVTDVDELPAAPAAPTVVSGEGDASTTSLKVIWHAPENTGTDITGYDVQYKKSTELSFLTRHDTQQQRPPPTTITGLDADTSYQVRVQARSDEGSSPWSLVGTGSTNKEGNRPPTFGETESGLTRNVFENTSAGEDVGAPVTADDDDATTLTYRLEGPDAGFIRLRSRRPGRYGRSLL